MASVTIEIGDQYTDRGDPSSYDFQIGDLTEDGAWHDMDLSAIVPEGAKFVVMHFILTGNATALDFALREKGNTNEINTVDACTQATACAGHMEGVVKLDSNRVIEYKATTSANWTSIDVHVRGWTT